MREQADVGSEDEEEEKGTCEGVADSHDERTTEVAKKLEAILGNLSTI